MRVYSQITKGQFTTKKKKKRKGKLLRFVAFCIMVQFGFLQQFRNETWPFHNDIRFEIFLFFFSSENVQLIFLFTQKKIANLKTLCQYWGPAQQHCGFLIHEERWWVGYSGKSPAGTSIYVESQVETWSRWEQIKIWMMFSKKQGIILDKASNNFLVSKRENPSWGSLPTTGVKVRTDKI